MEKKKSTNWVMVLSVTVAALLIAGVAMYVHLDKKVAANERIVVDGLRDQLVPEVDHSHVPCPACRASLNEGMAFAVAREQAEIILSLRLAETGHHAHDSGLKHAVKLIEKRRE